LTEKSALWFSLNWGFDNPAKLPKVILSFAALGDMRLKPEPSKKIQSDIAELFPKKRFVWLNQEHTRIVLSADSGQMPSGKVGDALVTNDAETVIGVTVADCLPIFLFDEATGARAICHSGWKGTGIVREALKLMKIRYGSPPAAIRVILGPCIQSCCYAVNRDRAESFAAEFGSETAFFRDGKWYIDIRLANEKILFDEGVKAIHAHDECTCCDTRFSSYRRQGKDFTLMLALCGE